MKIKEVRHLLTFACNLSCSHCYLNAGKGLAQAYPAAEMRKSHLNRFYTYFQPEVVSATGGEPLMQLSKVYQLAECLNQYGGALELVTNGFLLTGEIVEKLMGLNPKSFFQISLDGDLNYHNQLRNNPCAYDAALAAIKLTAGLGLTTKVRLTATDDNMAQLEGVVETLDALNSTSIKLVIRPVVSRGRAKSNQLQVSTNFADLESLASLPNNITVETTDNQGKCGCGVDTVAIDPQGGIFPCTYFVFDEKYRMGQLQDDPSKLGEQSEFAAYTGGCYARHLKEGA